MWLAAGLIMPGNSKRDMPYCSPLFGIPQKGFSYVEWSWVLNPDAGMSSCSLGKSFLWKSVYVYHISKMHCIEPQLFKPIKNNPTVSWGVIFQLPSLRLNSWLPCVAQQGHVQSPSMKLFQVQRMMWPNVNSTTELNTMRCRESQLAILRT